MNWLFVVVPFIVVGIGVIFVAFAGGAGAAREAYLTRGSRVSAPLFVALYVALGLVIPALVIADRGEGEGGVGKLRTEKISARDEKGKQLFIQTCKSCHDLNAVQAKGVTGPDLDELGGLDKERVLNAIRNGGTGQNRMPAGLLTGDDADAVATYVSKVAGQ
jgi:cytochrome c553